MSISIRSEMTPLPPKANAQYNIQIVTDPMPYQQFFDALSKSMFLQADIDE